MPSCLFLTVEASHCRFSNAERQAGKILTPLFIVFGLIRPAIKPCFTVSVADALFTRPLARDVSDLTGNILYIRFPDTNALPLGQMPGLNKVVTMKFKMHKQFIQKGL